MWLRASKLGISTRGLGVPWAYVRRQIARDWCVPPVEFDRIIAEDPEELRIELAIRRCEAECQ